MSLDESRNSAKGRLQQQLANNQLVREALEAYLSDRQQAAWKLCAVAVTDAEVRQAQGEARAFKSMLRDVSADAKVAP